MRKLIIAAILVAIASNGWAFGPSSDTSNDTRVMGEEGVTTEGSIDKRHSTSDRTSKSNTTSRDKSAGETLRNTAQAMKSGSLDITVQADIAFLRTLRELEETGVEPFATCRVVSRPKLPVDFRLAPAINASGGRMSINRVNMLKNAAENNVEVAAVTAEAPIREYRDCLALYGAVIKRSFENLSGDIASLDFVKKKTVKGALQEIRGIGFRDYFLLGKGALLRTVKNLDAFQDEQRKDLAPCRFEGSVSTIQCGASQMVLGSKPALTVEGVGVYGNGQYGGFAATYRISSGWSYADAWEAMKGDTTSSRFAKEYAHAVEDNKSKGNSVKALLAEKSAWDRSRGAKTSLSPDKFIPNVGGQ